MKKFGCLFFVLLGLFSPLLLFSGAKKETSFTAFEPATEQERVAQQVFSFVLAHGGTEEFVSAWLGNVEAESGLRPEAIQSSLSYKEAWAKDPAVDGYAFGLFQYDGGRRVNLLNYAHKQKKDWQDVTIQLEYAWDFDGSDSELLKSFSKRKDLSAITIDLLLKWERAGTGGNQAEQQKRIANAQGWYNRLVKGQGLKNTHQGGGTIAALEKKLGQPIYNQECYGLTAYYVDQLGGPKLMGSGHMNAWQIGEDYDWHSYGWQVIFYPTFKDLRSGDIINYAPHQALSPGSFGHTGVIASIGKDGQFTSYEQNAEKGRICALYNRTWGQEFNEVSSIVRKNK
ncbi:CHAP domain-containing protein [Listeria monocytogenes]|nr:CHAP domain-containing protein [Listeria monocytogenes]